MGMTANYGSTVTATQSPIAGNTNTNISVLLIGYQQVQLHYRKKQ